MQKKIEVTGDSDTQAVPISRRNSKGSKSEVIAISIPQKLHQTINGIVVKTAKSRSLVISELIEKGLNHE